MNQASRKSINIVTVVSIYKTCLYFELEKQIHCLLNMNLLNINVILQARYLVCLTSYCQSSICTIEYNCNSRHYGQWDWCPDIDHSVDIVRTLTGLPCYRALQIHCFIIIYHWPLISMVYNSTNGSFYNNISLAICLHVILTIQIHYL